MAAATKELDEELLFSHDLRKGDHVFRWTRIVIYPIQVHGIVLSAGYDCVTIVDLGLAANPKVDAKNQNKELNSDGGGGGDTLVNNTSTDTSEGSAQNSSNSESTNNASRNNINDTTVTDRTLDEMIAPEDRAMLEACQSYHKLVSAEAAFKDEEDEQQRITIHVLTEEKDIAEWKKVDYGETVPNSTKKWKWWQWWHKDEDSSTENDNDDESNSQKEGKESSQASNNDDDSENLPADKKQKSQHDGSISDQENNTTNLNSPRESSTQKDIKESSKTENGATAENQQPTAVPQLPKSDPATMVLARLRFLLSNPSLLPPHHILFCNSECIAVWCKTGRWSTLQASIFLHSTAAGNLKSAATIAFGVGTSTVTTTVPASGIAGWFGFTTTSTVGLLSVNPWLVPILAGYGIVAVGTPLIMYQQSKKKWEETTNLLNEEFWSKADADVYVEAIQSWSALK